MSDIPTCTQMYTPERRKTHDSFVSFRTYARLCRSCNIPLYWTIACLCIINSLPSFQTYARKRWYDSLTAFWILVRVNLVLHHCAGNYLTVISRSERSLDCVATVVFRRFGQLRIRLECNNNFCAFPTRHAVAWKIEIIEIIITKLTVTTDHTCRACHLNGSLLSSQTLNLVVKYELIVSCMKSTYICN